MAKKRRLLLTAGGAALALAVTGLAPATAGGGHHGYKKLTQLTELDSPRGVDSLGHGKTLVTEGDGTFSLVVERKHKRAKVVELGTWPVGRRARPRSRPASTTPSGCSPLAGHRRTAAPSSSGGRLG